MKRIISVLIICIQMMLLAACGGETNTVEDVHSKVHNAFYNPKSYETDCSITAYTQGGQNTYDCSVEYNSKDDTYTVISEDMTINVAKDVTTVTKAGHTIEAPSSQGDMDIFVNTFFKSYYESERASISTASGESANQTMLECELVNPTADSAYMKLWVDNDTAKPKKLQVFAENDFMNTEVIYNNFNFKS